MRGLLGSTILATALSAAAAGPGAGLAAATPIKHVLLLSIDGMHALDFINCAAGISGVNRGAPYCPNLAKLAETGVNYLEASTSKPSDSFPGLMALVSGGSPRSVGAFYDVAYDRVARSTREDDRQRRCTGRQACARPGQRRPARPRNSTRGSISTRLS